MKQLLTSNELLKKANITNLYACFTNYSPNLKKTMNSLLEEKKGLSNYS